MLLDVRRPKQASDASSSSSNRKIMSFSSWGKLSQSNQGGLLSRSQKSRDDLIKFVNNQHFEDGDGGRQMKLLLQLAELGLQPS